MHITHSQPPKVQNPVITTHSFHMSLKKLDYMPLNTVYFLYPTLIPNNYQKLYTEGQHSPPSPNNITRLNYVPDKEKCSEIFKQSKKVPLGSDFQIMTYIWIEGWGSNSQRTPICQVSIEAEPVSLLQNYPPDLGCQPQYIQLILNHMEPHYSAEVWEEPEALQCTLP